MTPTIIHVRLKGEEGVLRFCSADSVAKLEVRLYEGWVELLEGTRIYYAIPASSVQVIEYEYE